jgi:hypothetical protein
MVPQDNLPKERVQKDGQVSQNKVPKKVESDYIFDYYKLSFTAAYQCSNIGMVVNL